MTNRPLYAWIRRCVLVSLTLLLLIIPARGQQAWWVFFTDKGDQVEARLAHPQTFLGPAAIDRRMRLGIGVTPGDLPVWQPYVSHLRARELPLLATSRWMNAAVVRATEADLLPLLGQPWVRGIRPAVTLTLSAYETADEVPVIAPADDAYGEAAFQIDMLHLVPLHERGLRGAGVRIAVLDGGFTGVDNMMVFDSLRSSGRLIVGYDFVDGDTTLFESSTHGTQVLSTIAANQPGTMIGTAPDATYYLFRTENVRSETQQEEYNFLRAVEWADSIGVDIIHASLGYNDFDDDIGSYTYKDMNGATAIVTRAVDMAAARGILCNIAAGNEQRSSWHYISAPCDADSALCVGSVDRYSRLSSFSSVGPTADGRIKPDVVALGTRATVASPGDRLQKQDGTSVSSPQVAGLVACLMQAHPDRGPMDIIRAIRLSGDQAASPDTAYGYGIPHAVRADSLLRTGQDLAAIVLQPGEKPVRGRPVVLPEKPADPQPAFTINPRTRIAVADGVMEIIVPAGESIEAVQLSMGKQRVFLNPRLVEQAGNTYRIQTRYLRKGTYTVRVEAGPLGELLSWTLQ
ncbi:MAG: S8 family serine peptidase [Bacteroidia bacterium]